MPDAAVKRFFASPNFAVAGASQDTSKFGYIVLEWYHTHSLPVQPLNPKTPSIKIPPDSPTAATLTTLPSPSSLPHPSETSLSIITPPPVTLKLLKEAKEAGISAVWLQPGSFDAEGLEYAQKEFEAGVGGPGMCVLVHGEEGLRMAGKEGKKGVL